MINEAAENAWMNRMRKRGAVKFHGHDEDTDTMSRYIKAHDKHGQELGKFDRMNNKEVAKKLHESTEPSHKVGDSVWMRTDKKWNTKTGTVTNVGRTHTEVEHKDGSKSNVPHKMVSHDFPYENPYAKEREKTQKNESIMSFKNWLMTEKHAVGGFDYETTVNDKLKKHGKADVDSKTAGSSADAPDAKFTHNGTEHNVEIKKNSKAMFGQIELHHDGQKWDVSERSKKKYPETHKAIVKTGFIDKINQHWGKPSGDYDTDLKMGNVYHEHKDASPIKAHYGKDRKTDYIQIGEGHGFYHTGKDAAGLGSPELHGKTQLRARMKYRNTDEKTGKKKYGALVTFSLKNAAKSHHDLDAEVK